MVTLNRRFYCGAGTRCPHWKLGVGLINQCKHDTCQHEGGTHYFLVGIQGHVYLVLLFLYVPGASISTPSLPLDSGVLLSNRQFSITCQSDSGQEPVISDVETTVRHYQRRWNRAPSAVPKVLSLRVCSTFMSWSQSATPSPRFHTE